MKEKQTLHVFSFMFHFLTGRSAEVRQTVSTALPACLMGPVRDLFPSTHNTWFVSNLSLVWHFVGIAVTIIICCQIIIFGSLLRRFTDYILSCITWLLVQHYLIIT